MSIKYFTLASNHLACYPIGIRAWTTERICKYQNLSMQSTKGRPTIHTPLTTESSKSAPAHTARYPSRVRLADRSLHRKISVGHIRQDKETQHSTHQDSASIAPITRMFQELNQAMLAEWGRIKSAWQITKLFNPVTNCKSCHPPNLSRKT